MNILTNKSKKDYNYTSRYSAFPIYYHTLDKKYVYGLTGNLSQNTEYVLHNVQDNDSLDKLALKYYGRPDLFWVIADFNQIQDSYISLYEHYNYIYIPTLSGIKFTGV